MRGIAGDLAGISYRTLVVRRVYVVAPGIPRAGQAPVYQLTLLAWAAVCRACLAAGPTQHAALAAALAGWPRKRAVPFEWWEHTPWPEAIPRGRWVTRAVETVWLLRGPEDALLKRLPSGRWVAWRAELAEAKAWLAWNAAAPPIRPGYLYLAVPVAGGGPVKLGFSRDPEARIARFREKYDLRRPYRLARVVRGEPFEERELHRRLRPYRSRPGRAHGLRWPQEWYRSTSPVLECFDTLLAEVRAAGRPADAPEALYPAADLVRGLVPPGLPTRQVTRTVFRF